VTLLGGEVQSVGKAKNRKNRVTSYSLSQLLNTIAAGLLKFEAGVSLWLNCWHNLLDGVRYSGEFS
jgi:hypothetical protein